MKKYEDDFEHGKMFAFSILKRVVDLPVFARSRIFNQASIHDILEKYTLEDIIEKMTHVINPTNDNYVGAVAFVDGSFNDNTKEYGSGVFFIKSDKSYVFLKEKGSDKEMVSMRNISGELEAVKIAIRYAMATNETNLHIYYDYLGIEMWATGEWKRNKEGTKKYHEFIKKVASNINLKFTKVDAHKGIIGNEIADSLAKNAVGIAEIISIDKAKGGK